MPAVTSDPVSISQLLAPRPNAIDVDAHQKIKAEIRAAQEANLEEQLRLCSPSYAAKREAEKPVYKWRVEFTVIERKPTATVDHYADDGAGDDDFDHKKREVIKTVQAQNECEAWARACDLIGEWPSPRAAKPKFTRLKQVNK